jgi:hypothetical protein
VCHAVLQDPDFFLFLLRIDEEFAAETRDAQCRHCGGVLHSARYPRKPRGCPAAVLEDYSWRFSFTCAQCDQRATPTSVRFLGRRVYLAVVLTQISAPGQCHGTTSGLSTGHSGAHAAALARVVEPGLSAYSILAVDARALHDTDPGRGAATQSAGTL